MKCRHCEIKIGDYHNYSPCPVCHRYQNGQDMIELLPGTLLEFCQARAGHRVAVVFCPNNNYRQLLMAETFASCLSKFVNKGYPDRLIYQDYCKLIYAELIFILPDFRRALGIRPDAYYIFEQHPFEKENKQMWEVIRRWVA